MESLPTRPDGVPSDAQWTENNYGEHEWAHGEVDAKGSKVGVWRWWSAAGNLTSVDTFGPDGAFLRVAYYHPNGELAAESDVAAGTEAQYRCSDPACEPSTSGRGLPNDPRAWRAVKRPGVSPVYFDLYDREGNHLNPTVTCSKVPAEARERDRAATRARIDAGAIERPKDVAQAVFDQLGDLGDVANMVEGFLGQVDDDAIVWHDGDLHVDDLSDWGALGLSVLVVNGNLTVDQGLKIVDDPTNLLVVTGNLAATDVVSSGGLVVGGNLVVHRFLFGDYNHGSAYVGGRMVAHVFDPGNYPFTVRGDLELGIAFGETWMLNSGEAADHLNYNAKSARAFIELLHPTVIAHLDLSVETELDDPCENGSVWAYIDRPSLMERALGGGVVLRRDS